MRKKYQHATLSLSGLLSLKPEGGTIENPFYDPDYKSQEDQDREFYGLEYVLRIGHEERGW